MAKITDNQLIVLSKATTREDGAAVVPQKMNKAAAMKVGSSLIGRKLMREIRSKPGMPVWREDADGRSMSLVITRAGRDAIGIERAVETDRPISNESSDANRADRHLAGAAPMLSDFGLTTRARTSTVANVAGTTGLPPQEGQRVPSARVGIGIAREYTGQRDNLRRCRRLEKSCAMSRRDRVCRGRLCRQ